MITLCGLESTGRSVASVTGASPPSSRAHASVARPIQKMRASRWCLSALPPRWLRRNILCLLIHPDRDGNDLARWAVAPKITCVAPNARMRRSYAHDTPRGAWNPGGKPRSDTAISNLFVNVYANFVRSIVWPRALTVAVLSRVGIRAGWVPHQLGDCVACVDSARPVGGSLKDLVESTSRHSVVLEQERGESRNVRCRE